MNKPELIQKIKQLDGITLEEKAHLIELLNGKKYGLVWEDKPEVAEELLRKQLPVLHEVVEKRIKSEPQTTASPNPSEGGEKKTAVQNLQTSLFESENIEQSDSSSSPLGRSGGAVGLEGAIAPNHILIEGDNLHALTVDNPD